MGVLTPQLFSFFNAFNFSIFVEKVGGVETDSQGRERTELRSHIAETTVVLERIADERLLKLNFPVGDGSCPFGSSCFYAHTARDGTAVVIVPRTVENVNGAKCMKTYNLSDYLFPETGADGGEMLLQQIPVEEEA